jgi:uncharacterized protein (TIGR03435 family)
MADAAPDHQSTGARDAANAPGRALQAGAASRFAFNLEYRIQDNDTSRPKLFGALQEKMALKLETAKGPVEVLVIDHIDSAPAEN